MITNVPTFFGLARTLSRDHFAPVMLLLPQPNLSAIHFWLRFGVGGHREATVIIGGSEVWRFFAPIFWAVVLIFSLNRSGSTIDCNQYYVAN